MQMTATIWITLIVCPKMKKQSSTVTAPEELQMGDDTESSIYRSPAYPIVIDNMYINETGRYLSILIGS